MLVGVVGLGSIGSRHVGNLLELGAEVVGMDVSADARDRARVVYPHARIVDSLPFSGLDALVIAAPAENHLRWVEECVARRLPFFVEKPLGTLDQLPRWREIAALDLPVNQVGYMLRFHPDVDWLRAITPKSSVDLALHWDGSAYAQGLLESSHELDLLHYLCPDVGPVTDVDQQETCVVVSFGDSCVELDWQTASYLRTWIVDSERRAAWVRYTWPDDLGDEMYVAEMRHFIESVDLGIATRCPLADGLRVLDVCQQIEARCA